MKLLIRKIFFSYFCFGFDCENFPEMKVDWEFAILVQAVLKTRRTQNLELASIKPIYLEIQVNLKKSIFQISALYMLHQVLLDDNGRKKSFPNLKYSSTFVTKENSIKSETEKHKFFILTNLFKEP